MSSITLGIITGVGAAIGFGLSDFLAARASKQHGPWHAVFWSQLARLIMVGAAFAAFGWSVVLTGPAILWACLSGTLFLIGYTTALKAFQLGPVSLASPFVSGYAFVASLLSIVFLNERLQILQVVAVCLLVAGAMLASVSGDTHRFHKDFWRQPTVLLALAAALCIGISVLFLAQLVRTAGWQNAMLYQSIIMTLGSALYMALKRMSFSRDGQPITRTIVGVAFFGMLGGSLLSYGISTSLVAIVAPVASISPLITVGLALYFFKERLSAYQLTGALVVIIALSLLSVR